MTTASPGLSFGRRLLVSFLFLGLGLAGAAAGWKLKCEFDFRSSPRAASAEATDGPPNEPFTLFGLEKLKVSNQGEVGELSPTLTRHVILLLSL